MLALGAEVVLAPAIERGRAGFIALVEHPDAVGHGNGHQPVGVTRELPPRRVPGGGVDTLPIGTSYQRRGSSKYCGQSGY